LYIAVAFGHAPCVELLLGKGAQVDHVDKVGEGLQGVGAPSPPPNSHPR
jgi:hypothetical protein